eukprot:augustus_masked-scaffold_2-processed-gene-5.49-mRNA-1 protein AED:1.00 eAED:1.00 QI:0/-1/0/0/-1/1/1/0/388
MQCDGSLEDFEATVLENEKILNADLNPCWLWTVEDKREYNRRAAKTYRAKSKKKEKDFFHDVSAKENENWKLNLLMRNLQKEKEKLENKKLEEMSKWNSPFLLECNRWLGAQVRLLRAQRFFMEKFHRVKELFPQYDTRLFFSAILDAVQLSLKYPTEVEMKKNGSITLFGKKLRSVDNWGEKKKNLNKRIRESKGKCLDTTLKTFCLDKDEAHILHFKQIIRKLDYKEYADIVYALVTHQRYKAGYTKYLDIEYDIVDVDSSGFPFHCPSPLKKTHFDHQSFNVTLSRPKGNAPMYLVVHSKLINDTASFVVKCIMTYDPVKCIFTPSHRGVTSMCFTPCKNDPTSTMSLFTTTTNPKARLTEIVEFSKGARLYKKKMDIARHGMVR